jgi:ABC-type uncharacterized transport system permease subunit
MATRRNTTTKVPIKQSLIQRLRSMLTSIKLVFSHWTYIALAGTIATIFWVVFNVFEQLLFFSPEDALVGFILSNITAILLGIVVSMNVYVLKHSRSIKLSATSFFSGSSIGLCKLFFAWFSSSVCIRWSRDNNFNVPVELSNTTKNCLNSTPIMGLLLSKHKTNNDL